MASRTEYEMLFALNATMNGNFTGTFTKAQSEFSRLGKEIQELHKVQADISSFQKQQNAVESTRGKLDNLRQQHDLLQKEIDETTGSTTELEREKLKLEQRIKDTEAALQRQEEKLSATDQRLKEAGVDTSHLAEKDAELTNKVKELSAEQQKAAESAQDFGTKTAAAFEAAASAVAAVGLTKALKEVADAYVECVKIAADFEESMSKVEALSGATAEELAALNAKAKEMGAATKYTATEASEAFGYMALAGWDAGQMLAGIEPILNLATASAMDLGQASDIVTDYLTAFGLTAKDASKFVDQMAYAQANSNTTTAALGEAYKACASTAKSMGYSVEDTTAVLMAMANAGVKGSEAGHGLSTIMTRLATNTKNCADELGEYGVQVYDAQGNMRGLTDIISDTAAAFGTLAPQEQAALAKAIAGTNQFSKFQTILAGMNEQARASGQSITDYSTALSNCAGTGGKMAATMIDNLNGELALMNSATDALKTTIGEEFNPELRSMAESATEIITTLNDFVKANPGVVKGIATGAAVIGGVTVALTAYSVGAKVAAAANTLLASSIPGLNIIMGVTAAIAALTAGIVAYTESVKASMDESWQLTAVSRDQYDQLRELNEEYDRAVDLYGESSYEAQRLRWEIDDLTEAYENGKETFEEYQASHKAVMDAYTSAADRRSEATMALDLEEAQISSLINELVRLSSSSADAAENQDAIRAIVDRLNESLPDLNLNYSEVADGTGDFIDRLKDMAAAQAMSKRLAEDYQGYVESLSLRSPLENARAKAQAELDAAMIDYQAAKDEYERIDDMYRNSDPVSKAMALAAPGTVVDEAKRQLDIFQANLDEANAHIRENEKTISDCEAAFEAYRNTLEEANTTEKQIADAVAATREEIETLTLAYNEAYEAAYKSIDGQYALWDEAAKVSETKIGTINENLQGQIKYWTEYNANLEKLKERAGEIDGLREVIASFADGSAESVNAVAGMAKASDEDLAKMVQGYKDLQTVQSETSESLADMQTNFNQRMDDLQKDLTDFVGELDVSVESALAAETTINAYIQTADDMLPQVSAAYGRLRTAAIDALGPGTIQSVIATLPSPREIMQQSNPLNVLNRGYATGTTSASPGWAMVGENGPEAVLFRGGETVLNADRTAQALGGGYTVTVAPTYHIDGGADSDRLQEIFEQNNDALRDIILEVMEDASNDARRMAYA